MVLEPEGVNVEAVTVLTWMLNHVAVMLIPLMVWMTRSLQQVSQTIYGTKGDNGLNGRVEELRKGQDRQRERLDRHEGLFDLHKQRMDGIDRDVIQLRPPSH